MLRLQGFNCSEDGFGIQEGSGFTESQLGELAGNAYPI